MGSLQRENIVSRKFIDKFQCVDEWPLVLENVTQRIHPRSCGKCFTSHKDDMVSFCRKIKKERRLYRNQRPESLQ